MIAYGRIALAATGFLLLAASLVAEKKAGWAAVAGVAMLTALAVSESDPLLALGPLALVAARFLRPGAKDTLPQRSAPPDLRLDPHSGPASAPGKRP